MSVTDHIPAPVIETVATALAQLRQIAVEIAVETAAGRRLGQTDLSDGELEARVGPQYAVLAWFAACCEGQGLDPEAALLAIRGAMTRGTPTPTLRALRDAARCATPDTSAGWQARADEVAEIEAELARRGSAPMMS